METTTPSPCMKYDYFSRSFKIELGLLMFFGPILTTLWLVVVAYYCSEETLPLRPANLTACFTGTFVLSLILYFNAVSINKTKAIIIEDDRIIKKEPRRMSFLHWSNIVGIRPLSKKHIALETKGGQLFDLPLRVRGSHVMIENIFNRLREQGLTLTDADKLKGYLYHAAKRFNILYDLRSRNTTALMGAVALFALFHTAVAALYWDAAGVFTLVWVILNMLMLVTAYFIAENIHFKKLTKKGKGKGAYLLAGILALFAGMILAIAITEPADHLLPRNDDGYGIE